MGTQAYLKVNYQKGGFLCECCEPPGIARLPTLMDLKNERRGSMLYPFEIQPLETRPASGAVASLMNLLFSFVIGQHECHS